MNDRLKTLRLFVRVAYTQSFSLAGRELGLSQPSASRLIAELEKDIGGTLLQRHTRAVSLTEAGSAYLARVEQILADIDDADYQARDTDELRGHLKIGASSSFATRELVPRLSRFMTRHPELNVDICIDDDRQDLVTEGIDLALRVGALSDSGTVARRIGRWPLALAAAPSYLQAMGTPQVPNDLLRHRLISNTVSGSKLCSFRQGEQVESVRLSSRLTISVNEVCVAAAVAGSGIVYTGILALRRELDDGRLIQVLPHWDAGAFELHAVFPSRRAIKASARAFADFLMDELAAPDKRPAHQD
jgi:DNA-binding transcriptional LysR family regulator